MRGSALRVAGCWPGAGVRVVASATIMLAAAADGGPDIAEVEGFFGGVILSNGDSSIVHGLRIRRSPDHPWSAIAVMLRPDDLRLVLDFAPGVLPGPVDAMVRFTADASWSLTLIEPRDMLIVPADDPVSGELAALFADGQLALFPIVPVPGCLGDPFVPGAAAGRAAADGSDPDEVCPNNNCTDWLLDWLEASRSIMRESKNYSAVAYIRQLIESQGMILDRNHDHTTPGECEIYPTYVPGALGPPRVYISPECLRQKNIKGKINAYVAIAALVYSDPAVQRGDEYQEVIDAVILAYLTRWADDRMFKTFEVLKKVAIGVGDRQTALKLCMLLEASEYRGESTPEELKKLRRLGRELRKLKEARESWTEQQRQAHEAWVNQRYMRLRELILTGQWVQVAAEFGIPQDCIDPALVQCVAAMPTLCGTPEAGPCDRPNDTGGCEDQGCCQPVCRADPFCCDAAWDELCVAQAAACSAPPTCFDGVGDCCTEHGTAGCADPACCGAVCAMDPLCCDVIWAPSCAVLAAVACAETCGHLAPCGEPIAGSCCAAHANASCNDPLCCQAVCRSDPHCCDTQWDALCADRAGLLCAGVCTPPPTCQEAPPGASPCEVHDGPLADAPGCCEAVCEADAFCCDTQWDQICVLGAVALCRATCPPPAPCPSPFSCFEPHELPACDDPLLCDQVCGADPFCCEVRWDEPCVFLAEDAEEQACPYFCPPCPADVDGDGAVGVIDFLGVLAAWGPCPGCAADVNSDGSVGVIDFLAVLAAWGPCPRDSDSGNSPAGFDSPAQETTSKASLRFRP